MVLHVFIASLRICILIINWVLLISFIVIIPLFLASRMWLMKHSHMLFTCMSHLNFVWKCDMLQCLSYMFFMYLYASGGISFKEFMAFSNKRIVVAMAQDQIWSLSVFPLFFLKFVWMCLTQFLCSTLKNYSFITSISP